MSARTLRDLLAECLALVGVARSYGVWDVGGTSRTSHFEVEDAEAATVLADAEGRVNGGFGVATLADQLLHISSLPGGTAPVMVASDATSLVEIFQTIYSGPSLATHAVVVEADLDQVIGADIAFDPLPLAIQGVVLGRGIAAPILAGPGVLRHGAEGHAADLARRMGVHLFNTFGAKGVVGWDDQVHGGTVGLQARDLELAGIGPGLPVITSGIDINEVSNALAAAVVIDIDPRALAWTANQIDQAGETIAQRSTFYSEVSSIVGPEYEARSLTAPRYASQVVGRMPDSGVVIADAGRAGFWVGRCAPTARPRSVLVPSTVCDGFAVAGAVVARLAGRPSIAVVDGAPTDLAIRLIDIGRTYGAAPSVQCMQFGDGGGDARLHKVRSDAQWRNEPDQPDIDTFAVDDGCYDALVDCLGEISAWTVGPGRMP